MRNFVNGGARTKPGVQDFSAYLNGLGIPTEGLCQSQIRLLAEKIKKIEFDFEAKISAAYNEGYDSGYDQGRGFYGEME